MDFKKELIEIVKNSEECHFVCPFIQSRFLRLLEKTTKAQINIYTLPKTCAILEDRFPDIKFNEVDEEISQLHSKFYLVKNKDDEYAGIFGSPNLTGTSLDAFFVQKSKKSSDILKWTGKSVLSGISKKMNELMPEFSVKIKDKHPTKVYDGKEFFEELPKKLEKLDQESREFIFITHQLRSGFFEEKFEKLKDDNITLIVRKNLDGVEGKNYLYEEFPNIKIIETNAKIHGKVYWGFDKEHTVITCGSSNLTHSGANEGRFAKKETNIIVSGPLEIIGTNKDPVSCFKYFEKILNTNAFKCEELNFLLNNYEEFYDVMIDITSNKKSKNFKKQINRQNKIYNNLVNFCLKNNKLRPKTNSFMFNKAIDLIFEKDDTKFREKLAFLAKKDYDIINRIDVAEQLIKSTNEIMQEVAKEQKINFSFSQSINLL